jgi:hypothetical protein
LNGRSQSVTSASYAETYSFFAIGRRFGPSLFEKSWFRHKFPPRKVKLIRLKLERRSLVMIFLARHLFYLRTVTFLTCGAVRMTLWRFIVADALAALISVPLMIFLGYKFAEHLDQIRDMIRSATYLSGLVVALVIGLIYLYYRRNTKPICVRKSSLSAIQPLLVAVKATRHRLRRALDEPGLGDEITTEKNFLRKSPPRWRGFLVARASRPA